MSGVVLMALDKNLLLFVWSLDENNTQQHYLYCKQAMAKLMK